MANAKISDNSVFIPETSDVRNIGGLAGFTGSDNAKITGQFLAQSVVNESGSGVGINDGSGNINSRVAFYGVGNPSDTLAGAEGFQYYSANSANSTPASLQLGVAGGNQYDAGNLILLGNYIGGSTSPKVEFRANDAADPNDFKSFVITPSDNATDDQTWILPEALPTAGQVLEANAIATNDVTLSWVTPASGGPSAFTNKAGGATIDWDYATDGPNIKLTMTSGEENALVVSDINEFPDGSSGFLILDPVNTTTYRLPSEDYGSDTGIQSLVTNGDPFTNGSNPVRLQWVYDGSTFWFDIDTNMIEPIYPPTVEFDSTNLIGFWHPRSYPQATIGQVNGSAWPVLPATSATIGDLVPGGIGATFEYYPNTPTTPAYFSFGGTSNRFSKNIAGSVTAVASASFYFQQPADTGDCGLIDFYDGSGIYTECLYLINREFSLYTPGFTFGYPQLIDYTGTGGANLLNDWIFCTVAIDNVSNEITLWVGTQASLDAAVAAGGATAWNYDGTLGNTVNVDANGLYKEVASVTISELTWDRIFYGNSAANNESSECHMGMLGIYDVLLNDAAVATNWVDSRGTYFIT